MDKRRRAVVTGIGAVSPNGIGRERFWNATREGMSGVGKITRFDASGFIARVAGEVSGFDEGRYFEPKERQHVSRAAPMAIAAVEEAFDDAGIEPKRMGREELRTIGVMLGSGGGSQEFTEEQYRLYYSGPAQAVQRVYDSDVDDRDAGERSFDAVRAARIEPCDVDRLHVVDRCVGLRVAATSNGGSRRDDAWRGEWTRRSRR